MRVLFYSCLVAVLALPSGALSKECEAMYSVLHDDSTYEVTLPLVDLKDQCGGGSCWLQSFLTVLEHRILATTGEKVALSPEYSLAQAYLQRALEALDASHDTFHAEGGTAINAIDLVKKVGVVPVNAGWKPRLPLSQWRQGSTPVHLQMGEDIAKIVAAYHEHVSRLRPGSPAVEAARREAEFRIRWRVWEEVGPLPSLVKDGVSLVTPGYLGQKYLRGIKDVRATLPVGPGTARPFIDSASAANLDRKRVIVGMGDIEYALQRVKSALDRKESVWVGMYWRSTMLDPATQTLRYDASKDRSYLGDYGHAVAVVGYRADASGKIVELIVQNSATGAGAKVGHIRIDAAYLKRFLTGIYDFAPDIPSVGNANLTPWLMRNQRFLNN